MTTVRWPGCVFVALALFGCQVPDSSGSKATAALALASVKTEEPAKDAKSKEDELHKKRREFECARIALALAKLDATANEIEVARAVEISERAFAAARAELENFNTVVGALEQDERRLALDRAQQRVVESEQELRELEAMYAQEQFATTTKELVLTRGKAQLAMARRDLGLVQRRAEQQLLFEHPKRGRELSDAVVKAEHALADARAKLERGQTQRKLDLAKAENAVDDAERAVARLEREIGAGSKPRP